MTSRWGCFQIHRHQGKIGNIREGWRGANGKIETLILKCTLLRRWYVIIYLVAKTVPDEKRDSLPQMLSSQA